MSRFALGLAALTLVLVTGACEDDPEPKIAEPSSDAATEPTSDPPTSSASPEPEPLTPVQTVRGWIKGHNQALLRGDFEAVDALSLPTCKTCLEYLAPMRDVFASGGRFETKPWRIEAIKSREDEGAPNEVSVGVVIPGGVTYPSEGADPVRYETERTIMRFRVAPDSDGTLAVARMVFLS